MKFYISFILLFSMSCIFSQTKEIEQTYLNSIIQSGDLNLTERKRIGDAWIQLLEKFDGYPSLPYDEDSKRISYVFTEYVNEASKESLFKGVKEWAAISYGSLYDVLHYEDIESGVLVIKGWNKLIVEDIRNNFWGNPKDEIRILKTYHTIFIIVKDGSIKTRYTNLEYESESGGYLVGTTYIPIKKVKYDIHELYPVTKSSTKTWISRLSTLKETGTLIQQSQMSLLNYLKNRNADRNF